MTFILCLKRRKDAHLIGTVITVCRCERTARVDQAGRVIAVLWNERERAGAAGEVEELRIGDRSAYDTIESAVSYQEKGMAVL